VNIALGFCDRCGKAKTALSDDDHAACTAARELEPPRYCVECGRRLVVQVTPRGYSARCSQHGEVA
jgi:hypothetical protein